MEAANWIEKPKAWLGKPKEWGLKTREFWREVKSEMRKVSWPSRQEVVSTTSVVLGATVFFGVYLWVCDVVFYKLIDILFTRFGVSV